MRKWMIILKREFSNMVKTKSFVITTLVFPLVIAGFIFIQHATSNFDSESFTKKERNIIINGISEDIYNNINDRLVYINVKSHLINSDLDSLKITVKKGTMDGLLVFPNISSANDLISFTNFEYYTNEKSPFFGKVLSNVIGEIVVNKRLESKNLSSDEIMSLTKHPKLSYKKISDSGDEGEVNIGVAIFTLVGLTMMLYMSIIMYGQFIGRSVLNEKLFKTVEIMLSSVRPVDIMIGNIFGVGLAGLFQLSIWGVLTLGITKLILPIFGVVAPSLAIDTYQFLFFMLFFVLAFLLYSSMFASVGAVAIDNNNYGQLSTFVMIPLILCMMMINSLISSPDSGLSLFFSLFPFTSPIFMVGRLLMSSVPTYQIILSVALLILFIILVVRFTSKIFRMGILMTGKKVKFSEIVKWMRYK